MNNQSIWYNSDNSSLLLDSKGSTITLHWTISFFEMVDCGLSIWGKIMIPVYGLWLHGLYGLYRPRSPLSPERPLNLSTHSLVPPDLQSHIIAASRLFQNIINLWKPIHLPYPYCCTALMQCMSVSTFSPRIWSGLPKVLNYHVKRIQ